jgi:hypothetical protein
MSWRASKFSDRSGIRPLKNQIESDAGYVVSRFSTVEGFRYLARSPGGSFVFDGSPFTTSDAAKTACDKHLARAAA